MIEQIKREKDEEIRRKDALIAELMKGQEISDFLLFDPGII